MVGRVYGVMQAFHGSSVLCDFYYHDFLQHRTCVVCNLNWIRNYYCLLVPFLLAASSIFSSSNTSSRPFFIHNSFNVLQCLLPLLFPIFSYSNLPLPPPPPPRCIHAHRFWRIPPYLPERAHGPGHLPDPLFPAGLPGPDGPSGDGWPRQHRPGRLRRSHCAQGLRLVLGDHLYHQSAALHHVLHHYEGEPGRGGGLSSLMG